MKNLFQSSDAVWAFPDPLLLNTVIIKEILRMQHDYHRPVIGAAFPFAKYGALCAIHYSPEMLLQETAAAVVTFSRTGALPASGSFSASSSMVSVNQNMAEYFYFSVPDPLKGMVEMISPELEN
ncbi:MAG: hypothetical protein JXO49_06605 [Deltaproteobacteria bacterium]|nr:hypothetical protein [Candidatus Anaeroferrophillus wilburensis]MBN2888998.1 hypothetical protein [Deltaproteobacteria bacterium]